MSLDDRQGTAASIHGGIGPDFAGTGAQAKCDALADVIALSGHEINHLIFALLMEPAGICVSDSGGVPC